MSWVGLNRTVDDKFARMIRLNMKWRQQARPKNVDIKKKKNEASKLPTISKDCTEKNIN